MLTSSACLQAAVKVLGLVQDMLPAVAELNSQLSRQGAPPQAEGCCGPVGASDSQHYAVVESEHPYKAATVVNYKVSADMQGVVNGGYTHLNVAFYIAIEWIIYVLWANDKR